MLFTDITGIQRDWIDEAYAEQPTRKHKKWRDRNYPDVLLRRYIEGRREENAKLDNWFHTNNEAVQVKKLSSVFGRQTDWIDDVEAEDRAVGKHIENLNKDYALRSAIATCRAAALVMKHYGLVEKTVAFLAQKGEADLSQKLNLWLDSNNALSGDFGFYSIDAMTSNAAQKRGALPSFENEVYEAYAKHEMLEKEQDLKILKSLLDPFPAKNEKVMKTKEWQEDQAMFKRLIDTFQPLTIERFDVVTEAQASLLGYGADFSGEFDRFVSEIHDMRPSKPNLPPLPSGHSPIPGLR